MVMNNIEVSIQFCYQIILKTHSKEGTLKFYIVSENGGLKLCIDLLSTYSSADMKQQYLNILFVLQRLRI